jgi:hypothetical protein
MLPAISGWAVWVIDPRKSAAARPTADLKPAEHRGRDESAASSRGLPKSPHV